MVGACRAPYESKACIALPSLPCESDLYFTAGEQWKAARPFLNYCLMLAAASKPTMSRRTFLGLTRRLAMPGMSPPCPTDYSFLSLAIASWEFSILTRLHYHQAWLDICEDMGAVSFSLGI